MKKLLSIILTISVICSLTVPSFAGFYKNPSLNERLQALESTIASKEIFSLSEAKAINLILIEDINNCLLVLLEQHGELLAEALLNREENIIKETVYTNGHQECSFIKAHPADMKNEKLSPKALSSNYVGRIKYRSYSQGYAVGYNYIDLTLSTDSGIQQEYNFMGHYASVAGLVGLIASVFTVPGAIASAVASRILTICGIVASGSSVAFTLPTFVVKANWYSNDWYLTNPFNTSMNNTISGIKYSFDLQGTSHTQYSGSYYSQSAFSSHNTAFADDAYWRLYSYYDDYDIVDWI